MACCCRGWPELSGVAGPWHEDGKGLRSMPRGKPCCLPLRVQTGPDANQACFSGHSQVQSSHCGFALAFSFPFLYNTRKR